MNNTDEASLEWIVSWLGFASQWIAVLVALLGITGVVVGWLLWRNTEALDKLKDEKVRKAEQQMKLEIGIAQRGAEEAKLEQEKLRRETETIQLEVAEANARAAEANMKAEQEKLARLKIEEKLAWRELSAEQQERVVAKLKKFPGTEFEIRVFEDPESTNFLNTLVEICHLAGWRQRPITGTREISTKYGPAGVSLSSGIHVRIDRIRVELREPAKTLTDALRSEGIVAEAHEVELVPPRETHPERIYVTIGKKP